MNRREFLVAMAAAGMAVIVPLPALGVNLPVGWGFDRVGPVEWDYGELTGIAVSLRPLVLGARRVVPDGVGGMREISFEDELVALRLGYRFRTDDWERMTGRQREECWVRLEAEVLRRARERGVLS